MYSKFAIIDFVKNKEEIPIKLGAIKKIPDRFLEYYVSKFNPFTLSATNILDAEGYYVKLPLEKKHAYENIELTEDLLDRTLINLYDLDVKTVILPKNFSHVIREGIYEAKKEYILPYFLLKIIKKSLNIVKKELKNAEILIMADDLELSACCVNLLYPHVNYFSVVANNENIYNYFESITQNIFNDCGLNLQVLRSGKEIIKSADIIINTSLSYKNAFSYKKGAVFIDLAGNTKKLHEICIKRNDMVFIDNALIKTKEQKLRIEEIFMYMYIVSKDFRQNIIKKSFNLNISNIENELLKRNIENIILSHVF